MKKFFLLILIISGLLLSCSKLKVDNPENIGKQVFKILKKIDKTSKIEYLELFISTKDILEIFENVDLDSLKIGLSKKPDWDENEWNSLLAEELKKITILRNEKIEKAFNNLKEDAGKRGIIWNEVQYLDYTYEIVVGEYIFGEKLNNKTYPKMCLGNLYLKYKEIPFYVEIESIFKNGYYELSEINGLYFKH